MSRMVLLTGACVCYLLINAFGFGGKGEGEKGGGGQNKGAVKTDLTLIK
jgi:hypothetical protein